MGLSTRAAGGSVPLGLVAAVLFLVLFVWGCRDRKRHCFRGERGPPRSLGLAPGGPHVGQSCRLRQCLTLAPSAFLLSKLLAAASGGNRHCE